MQREREGEKTKPTCLSSERENKNLKKKEWGVGGT